jgi:hypothetical protein
MPGFQQFLSWEASTRDVLDVKRIYIDLAGDLAAGVALSEIVYWYLPNKEGKSRLRVEHDGNLWIAAPRSQWWDRCRLSPEQADYALGKLVRKGLIEKRVFKFNGQPIVHLRLLVDGFLAQLQALIAEPAENPYQMSAVTDSESGMGNLPDGNGKNPNSEWESHPKPLTETTNKDSPPPPTAPTAKISGADEPPRTPLEAERHPDLALFCRITGGIFPGQADWPVIVQRIRYLRQKHPELDEPGLVELGKPYYAAWTGRGYSRTHPDWLEWWMNSAIPPQRQKPKRKDRPASKAEPAYDYDKLRQKAAQELGPMIAQFEQKGP